MKKTISNIFYSCAAQLMTVIVPLVTSPYISRVLRPYNLGIYGYISSVSEILSVVGSIGLTNYAIREIAYVKDDKEKRSKIFFEIIILRTILFFVVACFYALFMNNKVYSTFTIYQLIWFAGYFLDVIWFFNGIEDFKSVVVRTVLIKSLSIASIFLFVKTQNDLWKYITLMGLCQLLGVIWCYPKLAKLLVTPNLKNLCLTRHLSPTLKIALPQIVTMVYFQMDKIMLENLTSNLSLIAFYDQADKLNKVPVTIISAVSLVMLPKNSTYVSNEDYKGLNNSISLAVKYTLLLTLPMTLGIITISTGFVPWFYGKGYDMVAPIMITLSPIIIARGLSSISANQYLIPTQNTRYLTVSSIFSAIINVIINYLTIPVMGVYGAVVGTLVAEYSVTLIQYYYMLKNIKINGIIKLGFKYFIFSVIAMIPGVILYKMLGSHIYLTVLQVFFAAVIYLGLLLISNDESLNIIRKRK
ncbi:Membrane protein involved in the export of O-antigen and teichoic acid [Kandleria vitulina]|uniref:oligosaccharide flippase family protein n=1 Tax=Kandleria vitulina TaxID=1630 RepID=UPI0008C312A3|nr:oligosaccharide flippase family protein [Kandleria vitulina]SEI97427.1 Membrane protein involved in the export of O-antigen and teichoic acid [Kandleria vitulina]